MAEVIKDYKLIISVKLEGQVRTSSYSSYCTELTGVREVTLKIDSTGTCLELQEEIRAKYNESLKEIQSLVESRKTLFNTKEKQEEIIDINIL